MFRDRGFPDVAGMLDIWSIIPPDLQRQPRHSAKQWQQMPALLVHAPDCHWPEQVGGIGILEPVRMREPRLVGMRPCRQRESGAARLTARRLGISSPFIAVRRMHQLRQFVAADPYPMLHPRLYLRKVAEMFGRVVIRAALRDGKAADLGDLPIQAATARAALCALPVGTVAGTSPLMTALKRPGFPGGSHL